MFKRLIKFILIAIICSMNIIADTNNEFYLEIDLTYTETSKDSNSQRYMVKVENNNVEYKYSYSGYPKNSNELINRKLSDEDLLQIINHIKTGKVNRSITEIKPTKSNGASMKVSLSLLLKMKGETTETKISGNLKIFRADGKINGELIKNKSYTDNVNLLISFLKDGLET